MKTPLPLVAATCALLLLGSSCLKIGPGIPLPPPVEHPLGSYLDSILQLTENVDSELVTQLAVALNDPTVKVQGTGQQEIAFAFRVDRIGGIAELGIYLPGAGFSHTVTVWDSATGQVLIQTDVPVTTAGAWNYTELTDPGPNNVLQANHGYIVGFNSDAVGVPINNATSIGNEVYVFNGIFDFKSNSPPGGISLMPFIYKDVTFEGINAVYYDTPISAPIFPGSTPFQTSEVEGFVGACDVGFVPSN